MTKFSNLLALLCLLSGSALASVDSPPVFDVRSPGHPGDEVQSHAQEFEARKHGHHHHHHHHHLHHAQQPQKQQPEPEPQPPQVKHGVASVQQQSNAQEDTVQWGNDSRDWKLVVKIDHTNFYEEMNTFVGADPTKGMVRYVSMKEARQHGLVNTDNGQIYMGMSKQKVNGAYLSIRPSTVKTFTEGLVIVKVKHMPAACGSWPAIFTVAPSGNWPGDGEIDIVEGVHSYKSNKMSIHTNPGCHMKDWALPLQLGELGSESSKNCAAYQTDDKGCAIQSQQDDFGAAVNEHGFGMYMMAWDENHGVSVYHSKDLTPDIASGKPDPKTWGKPTSYWPAEGCSPSNYFRKHAAVITNTFGGTWAGNQQVWEWKGTMEKSCKEKTGFGSFWDYVNSGKVDLGEAYWAIEDIQIWQ
ncbi:unnamed protein product, partial [Tilletia controversa]